MRYRQNTEIDLSELQSKVIKKITGLIKESREVKVYTTDGSIYLFHHSQDCCETVLLNDFEVSSSDIEGGVILVAEEVKGYTQAPPIGADSYTWTFYKTETSKGGLWMRWLGESNGY